MPVNGLDHVNIITADMDGTCNFYVQLLELERRNGPAPLTPDMAQWLHDPSGKPILHINALHCSRAFPREIVPGQTTGAIHHVALNCAGYDQTVAALDTMGAEYQTNLVASIGLRQVFTTDPNNVLLELNFFGD